MIVPPTPKLLDHIQREAHIDRIIDLRNAYRLGWLVRQATFNVASVSCLEDCDIIRLLADMERARECIVDGVSFEDAGLVRSTVRPQPSAQPQWSRSTLSAAERANIRASADQLCDTSIDREPPF